MAKSSSSGRTGAARAGFEYFDRRQMGPWVALRPLFRGWGLLVPLGVTVLLLAYARMPIVAVAALIVTLFLWSFKLTWQITGLLVRARAVLLVVAVLVLGNIGLQNLFGKVAGNIILVALVAGLLVFPPTRQLLTVRVWCVLDRHRMRSCLKACKVRTMNLDGALPFMLWARPTKTGERVWLWVRSGSSGDDIEDALRYIAPACFARDARIHRVRKLTTIVAVEVVRRDPLGTGEKIPSPLSTLTRYVKNTVAGEGTEVIRPMPIADVTATEPPTIVMAPRKGARKSTLSPEKPTAPIVPVGPPVVVAGEDLSDYID